MKKYKHKKTGIIAVKDGASYKLEAGNMIPSFIFEDTNDWEKVIEKDYEILSFKQNSEIEDLWEVVDTLCEKFARKSGQMFCTTPYTLEEILNNPLYSIHSIKRLSDGEVFSIGDKIKTCVSNTYASIYGFKIENNNLQINHTHAYLLDKQCPETPSGCHLYLISKKKKPLLTTEDGVDIFEGDIFYLFTTAYNDKTRINIYEQVANYHYNNCTQKSFSTKEAAKEYILMNKPCLSIIDVVNTLNIGKQGSWYRDLKKLVKCRL